MRYAAELVIFAVGITTVTAGAAGFSDAGETRDGTPVAAATCVTPTADEARQTPLRHNPYVL